MVRLCYISLIYFFKRFPLIWPSFSLNSGGVCIPSGEIWSPELFNLQIKTLFILFFLWKRVYKDLYPCGYKGMEQFAFQAHTGGKIRCGLSNIPPSKNKKTTFNFFQNFLRKIKRSFHGSCKKFFHTLQNFLRISIA
jgi:hypothetical protein